MKRKYDGISKYDRISAVKYDAKKSIWSKEPYCKPNVKPGSAKEQCKKEHNMHKPLIAGIVLL